MMDSAVRRLLICILDKVDLIGRETQILNNKMNQLIMNEEINMAKLRDDFNAALAELGTAIVDLANRISSLPMSVDSLSQADLDALKADAASLRTLAVANPDVPTDGDTQGAVVDGPTD